MYKVTVELHEYVKANSPEEAKQKFLDNFEFHDIYYGHYEVEEDDRKKEGAENA